MRSTAESRSVDWLDVLGEATADSVGTCRRFSFPDCEKKNPPEYLSILTVDKETEGLIARQLQLDKEMACNDDTLFKCEIENDDSENMFTFGGATSRGSVKLVHNVIASFNQSKKDIVSSASVSFSGLLSFPQLTKLNLKFSKWLLTRVDEPTTSIVVDKDHVYKFSPQDVHSVFGVPAAGRDVQDKDLDRSNAVVNLVRSRLGLNGKEARSFKAAQAILVKDYGEKMQPHEVDAFKTAFVVFIMGHFFAPTSKHNYCNIDYWPALADPSLINTFNWGKYIVEELCDAAKKLKADIRKNISVSNITGCTLFLQLRNCSCKLDMQVSYTLLSSTWPV